MVPDHDTNDQAELITQVKGPDEPYTGPAGRPDKDRSRARAAIAGHPGERGAGPHQARGVKNRLTFGETHGGGHQQAPADRQQSPGRADAMPGEFTEVTATAMDPSWITYDRGKPGTIAHMLGGTWWCTHCFALNITDQHVCADIENRTRRWIRAGLLAAPEH